MKQLSHLTIIWDEQPGGNAEHIADNFQTYEDVENVLSYPFEKTVSRRTGLSIKRGLTVRPTYLTVGNPLAMGRKGQAAVGAEVPERVLRDLPNMPVGICVIA